jgi:hypothetical protein
MGVGGSWVAVGGVSSSVVTQWLKESSREFKKEFVVVVVVGGDFRGNLD